MEADHPMPIYTAVSYDEKKYRWWEFTPHEVGCADEYNAWIPTWAFGRNFVDGKSIDGAVEPPLGLLLGTFGSAFCATVDQIYQEALADNKNEKLRRITSTLIYEKMRAANARPVTPATYNNHMYMTKTQADHAKFKTIRLMDAGIHFNLPMPPLLRPERKIDIIIACDYSASPEMDSGRALRLSEAYAKEYKYPFPDCTDALSPDPAAKGTPNETDSKCANQLITVLPGDPSRSIPTIIYLPLVTNPSYSPFCARKIAKEGGYTSTFNFQYKSEQANELSSLTASQARDVLPTIKKAIIDHMTAMQKAGIKH